MPERVRKGYADTSDGQVHFRSIGTGRPLILLHQSPSSSLQFEAIMEPLARRGFRAIAMDMPGYGTSDTPSSVPTVTSYAQLVQEAIRSIGLDQVDIFGHHTGASVAMMIAANYPSLVRRLVLWGAAMMGPEMMDRLANEQPPQFTMEGDELLKNRGVRKNMNPNVTIAMLNKFLLERLQTGDHTNWGHNAVGREDHEILGRRVSQPTLVTCSQGDYLTFESSKTAAALMPNGRFVEFMDASLDVPDEKPEELSDLIADFLNEETASETPAAETATA